MHCVLNCLTLFFITIIGHYKPPAAGAIWLAQTMSFPLLHFFSSKSHRIFYYCHFDGILVNSFDCWQVRPFLQGAGQYKIFCTIIWGKWEMLSKYHSSFKNSVILTNHFRKWWTWGPGSHLVVLPTRGWGGCFNSQQVFLHLGHAKPSSASKLG